MKITVLLFGILVLASCAREPDPVSFRAMSYNIAAGFGDLEAIAEVIRAETPDVVALQEVDVHWSERSDYVDQANALSEMLEMEVFYAPIYTFEAEEEGQPPRQYGLAFLSLHPITHRENHEITRLSTQEPDPEPAPLPGFPEVIIDIRGTEVRFFNTHLDYRADPAVRIAQIEDMFEVMGDLDRPTLLLGDLNARPNAPELQPVFDRFHDVWDGEADPGYTFPADAADRRIDYILHSGHFEVRNAYIVQTTASDHLPVVADFVIVP